MKLFIQRHAKTDQYSESGKDFDRKLLAKGINQAIELGTYFKEQQIDPALIYCSTAVRTRQTATLIQKNQLFSKKIQFLDALYLCGKDQLLSLLWSLEGQDSVLIIGHNNGISDLASYFLDEFVELRTGEFIQIDFELDTWKETSQGLGIVKNRFRPEV
jgi:phosphohistidine phosphatase